jgi:hypothetical protein
MKQLPYTIVQLSAFTQMLGIVYNDVLPNYFNKQKSDLSKGAQVGVSVSVGMVAGALSSIASHPGDAILTRINTQLKAAAAAEGGTHFDNALLIVLTCIFSLARWHRRVFGCTAYHTRDGAGVGTAWAHGWRDSAHVHDSQVVSDHVFGVRLVQTCDGIAGIRWWQVNGS